METWTKANEERLIQLNSFSYPSLVDEQSKIQKELVRLQNMKQLTEGQLKAKQEIGETGKGGGCLYAAIGRTGFCR